ncbi:preprotein translocase subunit SecY [Rubeoparvulum massiliense]|uniref:preprotein translocase subunit SecY n=1 Tax=Rubeoparvulum massiliense TaxID=1631346 RepID=UPI00065E403A|nr:preprotein translocase subunit SecY [Rubeoparvulum massiliense]
MFTALSNIWKVDDLRRKILFTLFALIIFRLGSFVPVPHINTDILKQFNDDQANMFGLFNLFAGGALENFSIFAMGIMPYITASIIMQLLSMDVVPKFSQWAREGEAGRRKIAQVTRYGTVILGFIQAIGLSVGFNNMYHILENPSVPVYLLVATTLTAGTAFLMWLGEQITEKGIGNGISIIIFAGIVAGFPSAIGQIYASKIKDAESLFLAFVLVAVMVLVVLFIIAGVIFVQQGVRRIPIQYAKRVVGRKMYGGQSTNLPIKVNAAGVIPVIFALSLVYFPATIASFWAGKPIADWIINHFNQTSGFGIFFYVLLIIGFTYFYTFIQINPEQLAENLKKNGGYIPGIRPGKTTSIYITRIMNRITLAGAIFLAAVSVLPVFFINIADLPDSVRIGGTALLIVTGVALDTMKQIESQLVKRHYKGFINK